MKRRTGEENFVSCMRKALGAHYGDKPVALGGAFQIVAGKAKLHVMVRGSLYHTYALHSIGKEMTLVATYISGI